MYYKINTGYMVQQKSNRHIFGIILSNIIKQFINLFHQKYLAHAIIIFVLSYCTIISSVVKLLPFILLRNEFKITICDELF